MAALQKSQRATRTTKNRYQAWRGQSKPTTSNDTSALLLNTLLGGLFGAPIFDSLGPALTDMLEGAMITNAADTAIRPSREEARRYVADHAMEEAYADLFSQFIAEQQAQQREMNKNKKMLMLAMLAILMQDDDQEEEPELVVAGDVLRRPSYARFKQNRHSMDCIRSAFARQADSVTAPVFKGPRYMMAG
jgi:hypothetical protein